MKLIILPGHYLIRHLGPINGSTSYSQGLVLQGDIPGVVVAYRHVDREEMVVDNMTVYIVPRSAIVGRLDPDVAAVPVEVSAPVAAPEPTAPEPPVSGTIAEEAAEVAG